MKESRPTHDARRKLAVRWKVLVGVGAGLIMLALSIDWPPPVETTLPETKSFLLFLGAAVGAAGLLAALSQK
jgi:hypothetical protein